RRSRHAGLGATRGPVPGGGGRSASGGAVSQLDCRPGARHPGFAASLLALVWRSTLLPDAGPAGYSVHGFLAAVLAGAAAVSSASEYHRPGWPGSPRHDGGAVADGSRQTRPRSRRLAASSTLAGGGRGTGRGHRRRRDLAAGGARHGARTGGGAGSGGAMGQTVWPRNPAGGWRQRLAAGRGGRPVAHPRRGGGPRRRTDAGAADAARLGRRLLAAAGDRGTQPVAAGVALARAADPGTGADAPETGSQRPLAERLVFPGG